MNKQISSSSGVGAPLRCLICGSADVGIICQVDGHDIWNCPACCVDFVWPMPEQSSLKELYDRREWFEGGEKGGYVSYDEQTDNFPQYLKDAFEVNAANNSTLKVLDVGCGYGTHLAVAAAKGWQCFGVEVSAHARKIAKDRHGDNIYLMEQVEDLPPCQYDLILMLDVIEHLADPYPLFYALFSNGSIGPQTRIIITTPNAKSCQAVADPEKWAYRHPPSHLVFYSAQALDTLMRRLRWDNIEIEGLHFLDDPSVKSSDGSQNSDDKFSQYAGLLCTAKGSDFSKFMHERYVPGTWNKIAEYEHIPRYVFARSLAKGLKVLDFGCGTGYGSAMLAESAESVVGLDISEEALQWARQQHHNVRLRFERRDDLGKGLPDCSFDLVTCFEMIEHVDQKTQTLAIESIHRLLKPGGKLVISTPNPKVTESYGENPFHLHEMDEDEFVRLLKEHFKYVQILKQWIRPSVLIAQQSVSPETGGLIASAAGVAGVTNELPEVAYIAICSDTYFESLAGICSFDSSFDYVASMLSAAKSLNLERIDKLSYVQKLRRQEQVLLEKDATIQTIQEMVKVKEATMNEAISGKVAVIEAMQCMLDERDVTIQTIQEMVKVKEATMAEATKKKQEALSASEAALETYRQAGLNNLLAILKGEKKSLVKAIRSFKVLIKILISQGRSEHSFRSGFIRKQRKNINESDNPSAAYHVKMIKSPREDRARVVHALANFMTGGSSRLVVDLFEHLGHCYEQEVVTSHKPELPAYVGLPVHEFTDRTRPDGILEYFQKFRPHLVHIHYWGDIDKPWYDQVFRAAEEFGCRVIENVNTPVVPYFAEHVDKYVYVSNYVLEHFGDPGLKALTVYPGSNFEIFKREDVNEVPDDCIGMVYRLEQDKLNEQAIDVFIEVVRMRPQTKVLIVGGGGFLEPYKKAAQDAGVANAFNFTGYVSYEALPALYNQMSLFVAPVWKESFGQVSPFAMSTGIPVVGYDIDALSEIIGDKTLLAPPGDSRRLAEIITGLLDDRGRRIEIGLKNRARAHELFSVAAMIDSYQSIYAQLIGAGR